VVVAADLVGGVGDGDGVAVVGVAGDGQVVPAHVGVVLTGGVGDLAGDVGHDDVAVVDGLLDVGAQLVGLLVVDLGVEVGRGVVAIALVGVQDAGDVVDGVGAGGGGAQFAGQRVEGRRGAVRGQRDAGRGRAAVVAVGLQR